MFRYFLWSWGWGSELVLVLEWNWDWSRGWQFPDNLDELWLVESNDGSTILLGNLSIDCQIPNNFIMINCCLGHLLGRFSCGHRKIHTDVDVVSALWSCSIGCTL